MSHQLDETARQRADTFSAILSVAGYAFIIAAILGLFSIGWFAALCLLAFAVVFFSLGAALDLLIQISRGLKRLESENGGKTGEK